MKKEYSKDELTVGWEQEKCIHSAMCVKNLEAVFNPKASPWINMDAADREQIMQTIDKCPSGALSYTDHRAAGGAASVSQTTEVKLMENGPMLVSGPVKVIAADGSSEIKEKTAAFCRCGESSNKPYCDGAHKKADFKG
jgi:uncharacterized Fe-S cluster protein YjdI